MSIWHRKKGYMSRFYKEALKLAAVCKRRSTRQILFILANEVLQNGASEKTDQLYERCIRRLSKEF